MTVWHLRDLMDSKKKRIHVDDIKHINIPNFDGLTIESMIEYAKACPNVMDYLPVKDEIKKLPRQYIANVIHTVMGKHFENWVDVRVEERNRTIKKEKNLMVEMDAEVAEIFR